MADTNLDIIINAVDNASGVLRGLGTTIGGMASAYASIFGQGEQATTAMGNTYYKSLNWAGQFMKYGAENIAMLNSMGAAALFVVDSAVKIGQAGAEGMRFTRQVEISNAVFESASKDAASYYDAVVRGAKGTVNEYQIMTDTNRAVFAGLFANTQQAQDFSNVVKTLSDMYGANFPQEWGQAIRAVATGRQFRLANLGIEYDPAIGQQYYKDLMGINRELTLNEKQQATLTYIMDEYAVEVGAASKHSLTYADILEQTGSTASYAGVEIQRGIGESLGKNIAPMARTVYQFELFINDLKNGKNAIEAWQDVAGIGANLPSNSLELADAYYDELQRRQAQQQYGMATTTTSMFDFIAAQKAQREEGIKSWQVEEQAGQTAYENWNTAKDKAYANEYEAATMDTLTKATLKYNDAIKEANKHYGSTKKNMKDDAWLAYGESINDTFSKILDMTNISTGVKMQIQTALGNVDPSTLALYQGLERLTSLGVDVQGRAEHMYNTMGGLATGKSSAQIATEINDYMAILTQQDYVQNQLNLINGTGTTQGLTNIQIDATLSDSAMNTIRAALAPGIKYIEIVYVDSLSSVSSKMKNERSWGYFGGGLAGGGDASGGVPVLVGEKGPEIFVPNSSGTVISNDKLGGNHYHFNAPVKFIVQGGEINMDKLARQLGV